MQIITVIESCGTRKEGVIIAVLPPGANPYRTRNTLPEFAGRALMFDGTPRDHESYLVAVRKGKTAKSTPVLYWPRVKNLKKVE